MSEQTRLTESDPVVFTTNMRSGRLCLTYRLAGTVPLNPSLKPMVDSTHINTPRWTITLRGDRCQRIHYIKGTGTRAGLIQYTLGSALQLNVVHRI